MRGMIIAFGLLAGVGAGAQTATDGCHNIDCVLAAVPMPTLTVTQVLEIAKQRMSDSKNYTVVGLDWCKASEFQPRYNDGTQYSPANDHANEYSWFLTYVYPDPLRPNYKAVFVLRIKPDGSMGVFIGTRS